MLAGSGSRIGRFKPGSTSHSGAEGRQHLVLLRPGVTTWLAGTTTGLDIIEIQMVAHVLTGCVGRWLEVPGRVPTLAERMVDNPSISLAIEHVDQYLRHVPPVFCFGSETRDIGQVLDRVNDIVQLMRINAQVIQLVTVGLAVDVFEFCLCGA